MLQDRPYQDPAAKWLSRRRYGFIVAPAGAGKTVIMAKALYKAVFAKQRTRRVKIGWLCSTIEQRGQAFKAMLQVFFNRTAPTEKSEQLFNYLLDEQSADVCAIEFKPACAAAETDWSDRDVLVVDEAHHAGSAEQWIDQILTCGNCLWGCSATPGLDNEEQRQSLTELFGEFHVIDRAAVAGALCESVVRMLPDGDPDIGERIDKLAELLYRQRMKWSVVGLNLRITGKSFEHKERLRELGCVWGGKSNPAWFAPSEIIYREAMFLCNGREPGVLPEWLSVPPQDGEVRSRALWESITKIGIKENKARNEAAIRAAENHKDNFVLMLVNSVEHGQMFTDKLPWAKLCNSKMGRKKRAETLADFARGKLKCIVATSLLDEGADLPMAEVLILVSGGRSNAKTEQRTGRVLRQFHDKPGATIYDFSDEGHGLMAKHSRIRLELYRKLGYKISGQGGRETQQTLTQTKT